MRFVVPLKQFLSPCLLSALISVAGCAGFSADGGFSPVAATVKQQIGKDVRWTRSTEEHQQTALQVSALLAQPLSVDDAVQIALLNNHALQADFQELGISEAAVVQAGRVPNPRFTWQHASAGGLYDVQASLTFNLLAILTVPYAHGAELRKFAATQDATVLRIIRLADDTRAAYYTAVAAHDVLQYAWKVKKAAETSAELAHRMLGAGNWNRVDQAREQGFYLQAMQDLARTQLDDETARAALYRLLGLGDDQTMTLAPHLPDLPTNIVELPHLEQTAMDQRIDLRMRRTEMDELTRRLRLTKATRWINVLDVGPTRVREGTRNDPYENGYTVSLEVPLFDSGAPRVRRAEAVYAQSLENFTQAAVDARAEVRVAAVRYRLSYEMAMREREDFMRLRAGVVKQDVLRYNASLISVFDLLADARQQIAGVDEYIQGVRDFWIAKSRLDTVLIAGSSTQ